MVSTSILLASMKNLELARLNDVHVDHLDMFLPPDIDISGEGHMGLVSHGSGGGQEIVDVSHSSEDRLLDIPWTELCSKSRSRCRKLNFLSNGGRSYLER